MTITYGFYNSVSGDRAYNALQMSSLFDGVITDGVFETIGNKLVVRESTGMNVIVGSGKAWFNHTWTINDSDLVLVVTAAHVTLPRIDTVILEVNAADATRANTIKIIDGTPASVPAPATLTNSGDLHQNPLGYIYVGAGVTSILAANLTNLVGTASCPYITVPQAAYVDGAADILKTQVFS